MGGRDADYSLRMERRLGYTVYNKESPLAGVLSPLASPCQDGRMCFDSASSWALNAAEKDARVSSLNS